MKIRIATWNVNSIRVRLQPLLIYLESYNIDMLLLQETKCQDKDFPVSAINAAGYNVIFIGQKSYNGVAIISKFNITFESNSINNLDEARYVEVTATINGRYLRLISVYVPNGQDPDGTIKIEESERFKKKLQFYKDLNLRLLSFQDEIVICGGDFNVAKDDIDLWNPSQNREKVGFHSAERILLKNIENESQMVDLYRYFNKDKVCYSWWDYRTKAFDRNLGWRIDYIFASKVAMEYIKSCEILTEIRGYEKASDHTIVYCDLDI